MNSHFSAFYTHPAFALFDWGSVSIEQALEKKRVAILVFNLALFQSEKRERAIRFIAARIVQVSHFSKGFRVLCTIDDRAEMLSAEMKEEIQFAIESLGSKVAFFSQGEHMPITIKRILDQWHSS